jgi:mono/diheme cytochrome c family protein
MMRGCCQGEVLIRAYSMFAIGLCFLLATSLPVRAQQSSGAPLTETQKDGRRIFQQRCAVCHTLPTVVSKRYGPALYKEIVQDNEDNIRDTILEGREGLMPGFKYGLTRAEVDSIIEYLKTVNRPARPKNNPNQKEGTPASAGE